MQVPSVSGSLLEAAGQKPNGLQPWRGPHAQDCKQQPTYSSEHILPTMLGLNGHLVQPGENLVGEFGNKRGLKKKHQQERLRGFHG